MENLHTDILENILSQLPLETILHAKRVCPTWRSILRNKKLAGFLFAYDAGYGRKLFYEDDYDHSKMMNCYSDNMLTEMGCSRLKTQSASRGVIVGSCNGLVCFGKFNICSAYPYTICNPLTGESVCLPEFSYREFPELPDDLSSIIETKEDLTNLILTRFNNGRLTSGFGYCPSTNEYKVVAIHPHEEEHKAHVQVYTLGRGDWRYIEFSDHRYKRCAFNEASGIYANGELYWLQRVDLDAQEGEIVAFDLEHEKFRHIPLPNLVEYIGSYGIKLLGGNNNLYLVQEDGHRTDIWIYKDNDTSVGTSCTTQDCNQKQNYVNRSWSSCWIKEFSIESPKLLSSAFAITRSNAVLLWTNMQSCTGVGLYCYDPTTSALNCLWDHDSTGMISICAMIVQTITPPMHSVVSLKDLGETNVTYVEKLVETNVTLKDICQTRNRDY